MFQFNNSTISDSTSLSKSIFDTFYPNGKVVIQKTTLSQEPYTLNRTLTTRSLSEIFSGDVLFRSPKFSNSFYNRGLSSSLNSLITGGSEAAFRSQVGYSVENPENPGTTTVVNGGAALARNIVSTAAGQAGSADYIQQAASSVASQNSTFVSYPTPQLDIPDSDPVHTSPSMPNDSSTMALGGRDVVLESNSTAEERTWISQRSRKLRDEFGSRLMGGTAIENGFQMSLPDGVTGLYSTSSHFPGAPSGTINISQDVVDIPGSVVAWVSPTLIELLLFLNSKIDIAGGFGLHRAAGAGQGSNGASIANGSYVSDHVFGRAFDIAGLGIKGGDYYDLGQGSTNLDQYRKGVTLLFETLAAAPMHLIPDFFNIHPALSAEFGIVEDDWDPEDIALKKTYPHLKYSGFKTDSNHDDHIHISIAKPRAGYYTGPDGRLGDGITTSSTSSSGTVNLVNTGTGSGTSTSAAVPSGTATSTTTSSTGSIPYMTADNMERQAQNFANMLVTDGYEIRPLSAFSGGQYLYEVDPATGLPSKPVPVIIPSDYPKAKAGDGFLPFIRWIRSQNPFYPSLGTTSSVSPSTSIVSPTDQSNTFVSSNIDLTDPKFTKNYLENRDEGLNRSDIYTLLRGTVVSDEAAAIFCAITVRESGSRPVALNPRGNDWSVGLFQCNLRTNAHGKKEFLLPYPNEIRKKGWQLGYKNWEQDGVTEGNFNQLAPAKATELTNNGKDPITIPDPVIWIPINQAYMLYTVFRGSVFDGEKAAQTPESGYIFGPWGEYGGGPSYGFISSVSFKTAVDIYISSGKPASDLRDWVLEMFRTSASGTKSAQYAENWVNGWYYRSSYSSSTGWTAHEPVKQDTINY